MFKTLLIRTVLVVSSIIANVHAAPDGGQEQKHLDVQQQPPLPKPAEVQQQPPLPKPAEVQAEGLPNPAEVQAEALPKPAEEQQVPPPTKPADVQLKDVSVKVEKNELAMNSNEKNDKVASIEKIEKDELHMKSEYANLESEIVELSNIKVSVICKAGAAPFLQ